MHTASYIERRGELETYFDRTAADAWAKLTSDAPVSGVRATVRAGRDAMRATLLNWLPDDLTGRRILDAGCGAGQFSIEAARRGADIVAIDLSRTLVDLARERHSGETLKGSVDFRVGDMFDPALGRFDHVVAMDSLIHYGAPDIVRVLEGFAARTEHSIQFTFAPQTPLLSAMHAVGKLFPHGDRAPAIQPVAQTKLCKLVRDSSLLSGWAAARAHRVQSGFYISNAMELATE
ncbi:MAG: magnesium protoporphyrin IX methyltransferase [Pseudomonadota bacterium]